MSRILESTDPPKIAPGLHCWKPYTCEFLDECTAGLPKDWVARLPRVTEAQIAELTRLGVSSIADIPDDLKLSMLQARVRAAHKTGVPFVSATIQDDLRPLGPPAIYLDFESMVPGLPLYSGTRPYQHIPFLFSMHRAHGGVLTHTDFIAPPGDDPRRAFAEELIRKSEEFTEDPILVYSPYERRIVSELAHGLPDLAGGLQKIIGRLQDLHSVVRKSVYRREFNGSFSIKNVAPVLAADVSYADLDIKDGSTAASAYQSLVEGTPSVGASGVLSNLRAYCERDTLAMVRVHQALIELADKTSP